MSRKTPSRWKPDFNQSGIWNCANCGRAEHDHGSPWCPIRAAETQEKGKAMSRKTWDELPASEREQALQLIDGERAMWRHGKNTNWHPASLPTVRINYRALGAAIAALSAPPPPRKARRAKGKK